MKKKLTAADRPQFHRDAAKMMDGLDIQIGEPDAAAVILCSRAVDFDPETNVLWELEANKSAVRPDVHCSTCDSVVALSTTSTRGIWSWTRNRASVAPRAC